MGSTMWVVSNRTLATSTRRSTFSTTSSGVAGLEHIAIGDSNILKTVQIYVTGVRRPVRVYVRRWGAKLNGGKRMDSGVDRKSKSGIWTNGEQESSRFD